jgi:hypothetical protein
MLLQGIVGPQSAQSLAAGSAATTRMGQLNDIILSELHGKFYEQNYRGNLFSVGMGVTALSANTIALTATATPIIGVWNPSTSPVNLVIAKAKLQLAVAGNSAVAPGGFVWATSVGNAGITTGLTPTNRKTMAAAGSQAKGFNISTALTGLTNNLVVMEASAFGTLVVAQGATGTPIIGAMQQEEFDGSLIVPPGGVLALLNTVSTVTVSVAAGLSWEEVPV